jgi:hypothetical protein
MILLIQIRALRVGIGRIHMRSLRDTRVYNIVRVTDVRSLRATDVRSLRDPDVRSLRATDVRSLRDPAVRSLQDADSSWKKPVQSTESSVLR